MSTSSLVHGIAGFATLHPVFTLAPVIVIGVTVAVALRRSRSGAVARPARTRRR